MTTFSATSTSCSRRGSIATRMWRSITGTSLRTWRVAGSRSAAAERMFTSAASQASACSVLALVKKLPPRWSSMCETILHHGSRWFAERKAALWSKDPDLVVIGRHVSPACYIRESFPAALYLAWKYADDFEAAVVANTMVGGDNCHRGAVVGALVGAACGFERLPQALREGLNPKTIESPPKTA